MPTAALNAQRVNSSSSSKASAHSLPQKRRTLSSGLSQYQQAPLGGRFFRVRTDGGSSGGAAPDRSSGTLSCIGSKIPSFPGSPSSLVARLLQRNIPGMRIINRHERAALPRAPVRPVIITVSRRPIRAVTTSAYTYSDAALRPGGAKYFFMGNAAAIASDGARAQKSPLAGRAA